MCQREEDEPVRKTSHLSSTLPKVLRMQPEGPSAFIAEDIYPDCDVRVATEFLLRNA